jgi:hypothetical protein
MAALSTHAVVAAWSAVPLTVQRAGAIVANGLLSDFAVEGVDHSSCRATCAGSQGEAYFVTLDVPPHGAPGCTCVCYTCAGARSRGRDARRAALWRTFSHEGTP